MVDTQPWRPRSFRRKNLFLHAALLMGVIIALAVIGWFAAKHDGIVSASSRPRYLWTYGPTASRIIKAVSSQIFADDVQSSRHLQHSGNEWIIETNN
jgi:hypothetical protein